MSTKLLFREEDDRFTPEGIKLDAEMSNALRPIFSAWYKKGYSARDISHIAMLAAQWEECGLILTKDMKEVSNGST